MGKGSPGLLYCNQCRQRYRWANAPDHTPRCKTGGPGAPICRHKRIGAVVNLREPSTTWECLDCGQQLPTHWKRDAEAYNQRRCLHEELYHSWALGQEQELIHQWVCKQCRYRLTQEDIATWPVPLIP